MYKLIILSVTLFISACNLQEDRTDILKENLGKKLFNDMSLSRDGTQSCASCHDSQHAFIDPRANITSVDRITPGAVSAGQDKISLGDINTPSAAYKAFVPDFHFDNQEGLFKGGLFLNGRATNLAEQAKQPFLNPVEMQNSKEGVVSAVMAQYAKSMQVLYGDDIFNDMDKAFDAVADAITAFEETEEFSPFNSRFDRYLRGEARLTEQELRGLDLFKAEDKGNCAACHPVPNLSSTKAESLFTDFTYDNLGVPKNIKVRLNNGKGLSFLDDGLFDNSQVNDPELRGAFRVSSLRNIAVTAPYMHNGVFKELATVVHFYNSRDVVGALNPETGSAWRPSEVDGTKNTDELGNLGLTNKEIDDIVVFLKTLTDECYEHMLY